MNITVLGIGAMGSIMARRLCEAGHSVHVWNRTQFKADRLTTSGATVHVHAADAVRSADTVICLLESGPVVRQVLFSQGTAQALKPGAMVIDMSSTQPSEARDHAAQLNEIGALHLDAPMSGGIQGAKDGTLVIMVGGSAAVFNQAKPIFEVFGRATHVGPHGSGQLAKLANQMIVGITIGAVAEALLLCEKGGASPAKVLEAITGGFADSRILQVHGRRMIERDFTPYARMSIQLRDLRNAQATAEEIGLETPITALFEKLYSDGMDHGLADLDHSGLFIELATRNGMN